MTRALIIAALILGIATPAQAQMFCDTRNSVIAKLVEKYGEVRKGAGLAGGVLLEIWVSEATGTFSILQTYPNGWACLMAAGGSWHDDAGGVRPETMVGDPA